MQKRFFFNNRTEVAQLLITYKAIRWTFYSVSKIYNILKILSLIILKHTYKTYMRNWIEKEIIRTDIKY